MCVEVGKVYYMSMSLCACQRNFCLNHLSHENGYLLTCFSIHVNLQSEWFQSWVEEIFCTLSCWKHISFAYWQTYLIEVCMLTWTLVALLKLTCAVSEWRRGKALEQPEFSMTHSVPTINSVLKNMNKIYWGYCVHKLRVWPGDARKGKETGSPKSKRFFLQGHKLAEQIWKDSYKRYSNYYVHRQDLQQRPGWIHNSTNLSFWAYN